MTKTSSDFPAIDEDGPSLTIAEFCRLENISRSQYHKNKRLGCGPRELRLFQSNIIRITPAARREWRARMEKWAQEKAGRLEQGRRVELATGAGKEAAKSLSHVSRRGPRNRTSRSS